MSAVKTLAHKWYKTIVVIHIDNSAFQLSAKKGWSRADRLNDLLKELFFLCVKYECVIQFAWIPTAKNILADVLSRKNNEPAFLLEPKAWSACWQNTEEFCTGTPRAGTHARSSAHSRAKRWG